MGTHGTMDPTVMGGMYLTILRQMNVPMRFKAFDRQSWALIDLNNLCLTTQSVIVAVGNGTHDCAPSTMPFATMTISTIIEPPAKFQPLSVVFGSILPSLPKYICDIDEGIRCDVARRRTIRRHVRATDQIDKGRSIWMKI